VRDKTKIKTVIKEKHFYNAACCKGGRGAGEGRVVAPIYIVMKHSIE